MPELGPEGSVVSERMPEVAASEQGGIESAPEGVKKEQGEGTEKPHEPQEKTPSHPEQQTGTGIATAQQKDELTIRVEHILEEDLGDLYAGLPEDAKPLFRKKGEEAATGIAQMISTAKVKVAHVLQLIRTWLLTIPKVNKYFLEQEAKIKTDDIIEYAKDVISKQV